jgi:hypothetical protein
MGRPSLLEASAEKRNGCVAGMGIGSRCVPMMQDVLEIEPKDDQAARIAPLADRPDGVAEGFAD